MTAQRHAECDEYVTVRLPALRRLAYLLCQNWHTADDLVQSAIVKVYMYWAKAAAADNIDAYVNTILVREFLREQRSSWTRRVSLTEQPPEVAAPATDLDDAVDLQTAIAALPPRQRAALVLRFYCDLDVDQTAQWLGCAPGTVKSQTAKAIAALRRGFSPDAEATVDEQLPPAVGRSAGEVADHA